MRLFPLFAMAFLSVNLALGQIKQELDLASVVQIALERHPSLKVSKAQVESMNSAFRQAKAGFLPQVDLVASYTQLHRDPSFTVSGMGKMVFGESDNPQLSWVVKTPIYTGGKLEGLVRQTREGLKAAQYALERQRQKVALEATIAYLNVLKARGFVRVMKERVKAIKSQRDDIAKMLERGVATKVDLLRAETALSAAQEELTKAQNGEALAIAALANAMGLSSTTPLNVTTSATIQDPFLPNLPEDLQRAIEEALKLRPEIKALEAQLEAARYGVVVAKSEQKPQIGFMFQYDAERQTTMPDMGRWIAGIMLTMNLFDGGATQASVKRALSEVSRLEAMLAELRNGITLEVTNAFLNLRSARERVKTAEKAVETAQEGFRLTVLGYQNGVNTITDFLTAQSELTQAQVSLIAALSDLRIAEAQLWFALGRDPEALLAKAERKLSDVSK